MTILRCAALPQTPPPTTSEAMAPATYVPLPRRLLEDLRDAPVAIGVYALLGRLYQITGAPIPLSTGDLQAYDPALSYGAARRALERLADSGYAIPGSADGRKLAYLPTWGRIDQVPRPWDRQSASMGRPRHIAALRLDDRLLDLCLGRLRPHKNHRALVERYLTAPLLGLREIGAYAMALLGLPLDSTTLTGLGLISPEGRALPLPDDRTVLAIASQRAAGARGVDTLTGAGWRYVGLTPAAPAAPTAEPLFFVPADMIDHEIGHEIGHKIGHVIGMPMSNEGGERASERQKEPLAVTVQGSYGSTDSDREDRLTTSRPGSGKDDAAGGGISKTLRRDHPHEELVARHSEDGICFFKEGMPSPRPSRPRLPHNQRGEPLAAGVSQSAPASDDAAAAPAIKIAAPTTPSDAPDTATARLLRGVGVRADVAARLADRPAAQVEQVIAQARARKGIRDLAGWIVSALRALPAAEELAPPPPKVSETAILLHPRLSGYERQRWLMRFRKADPVERPAILARFHAEHPLEDSDDATT